VILTWHKFFFKIFFALLLENKILRYKRSEPSVSTELRQRTIDSRQVPFCDACYNLRIRPDIDENDDGNSCVFLPVNLDDFRPFQVATFDIYARGNPMDNKPIDGHCAPYIIVVARKDLNKDHNNSRYRAMSIVKLNQHRIFESILLRYMHINIPYIFRIF